MSIGKDNALEIYEVLEKYFLKYQLSGTRDNYASVPRRECFWMVFEVQALYQKMSFEVRGTFFVPGDVGFLADPCLVRIDNGNNTYQYEFLYEWPEQTTRNSRITTVKTKVDRVGDSMGEYFCPLQHGDVPYSIEQRSLPYYFLEHEKKNITKAPHYHRYDPRRNRILVEMKETKPAFGQEGGAIEYRALNVDKTRAYRRIRDLIRKGELKEIN